MATKPPGKEKFEAPLIGTSKNTRPPSPRMLHMVMALVAVVFLGGGYLFYHLQEQQMRQRVESGLSIVAQLKVDQITEWRAERLTDADVFAGSPFFTEGVAQLMASPTDTEAKDKVLASLAIIGKSYPYQDILLVDVNGSVLLSLNDSVHRLSDMTLAQLAVAIKEHKAVFTDFHYPPDSNSPHLDVIAPLFPWQQDSQQTIGAVVLSIDPSQYLYPLVQSWPFPSETAETLLVERDGDQVLFLNELRHQKGTAFKLRIPLSRQEVPAVMAVLGKEGVVEGRDYRGVETLAVLKHIPDSPWYMVAKIDTSEALSAWRFRAGIIMAFVAGLLAAALAGIGLIWQRRQRLAYQALYQAELESQALRSHFEYLVKYANDIILLVDENQNIVEANDRALETYGYTRQEMLGMPLAALMPPGDLPSYQSRLRKIQQKGTIVAEAIHQRKNGSTFPVEVSGRTIKIEDKPYLQEIIRDITERKRMEEQIKAVNRLYALLSDINQAIVRIEEREGLFRAICQIAIETGKFRMAWIGLIDEESGEVRPVAHYGHEDGYLKTISITTQDEPSVRSPTSIAIHEGAAIVCNDIETDLRVRPWRDEALKRGYHSLAAIPLKLKGKVIGNFNVYSENPGFFSEEEQKLLGGIGNDISYAIEAIEIENERKRAEETLKISEAKYRLLAENVRDVIWTMDMNLRFTYMSPSVEYLRGYTAEEVMPQSLEEVFTPSSMEVAVKAFEEELALESMEQKDLSRWRTMELEHIRKDGSTVWVEIRCTFLRDQDGRPVGILGVSRDITERKRAEEALRRSEQNFRDSIENSPLGIRVFDKKGKTLYINRALLDIWGYSSVEELEAVPRKQRYTPQSYAEQMERLEKRKRGEYAPLSYEVSIVRSDGQVRHLSVSRGELLWNGEKQFQVVYQDITERKKAEEEYQTIIRTAMEGFWLADMQGHFLDVNDAYCHLIGYSRDELLNMSIPDVEATEKPEEIAKRIRKIKEVGYDRFETHHRRKDGEIVDVEVGVNYLPTDGGRMFVFLRDITERKRAEEERRQLEQKAQLASRLASVGEMASGIAHEINNPLTGVIGYAQLLMQTDVPKDIKKDIEVIYDGAQRVAGIVKKLLTFARQYKPEQTYVDINEIIETTLDLRAYHLKTNNIKVTTKLAPDLPITVADAGQLQQVFLNLIVNAETEMRLAHGKGKLLIKTEQIDNTIQISFKDDGQGITKGNLERIFDPFFTTREVGQGTGLGLSVCHGIITEHNGRIRAESKLGKGATFIVELPVVTEAKQLELAEPDIDELKEVSKAKILVVDDEPVILQFLSRVLSDEGHEVETVDNADDALEMVKSKRYSLILLDIKMPGMSGIELYKRMQKMTPSLAKRVMFVTGDIMGARTTAFLSKTKAPHITKPFDAEQLKKEVKRILS